MALYPSTPLDISFGKCLRGGYTKEYMIAQFRTTAGEIINLALTKGEGHL